MADRPRSLGFATDLELLLLQGSTVQARDGYLVVHTPANPTYHWGNHLVLEAAPAPGSLAAWLAVFREEHPGATHVAIGIDDPAARLSSEEAGALGLEIEGDVVLSTSSLGPVSVPDGVELRLLEPGADEQWSALVDLELGSYDGPDPASHRVFVERRLAGHRGLVAAGHGVWCAAYVDDGTPVANLGIFALPGGLARYQDVMTDAAYRRRGIAGALVGYAGHHALSELGARTLVIVADREGPAIGVYRRAGFTDAGDQWALYRGYADAGRVPQPS